MFNLFELSKSQKRRLCNSMVFHHNNHVISENWTINALHVSSCSVLYFIQITLKISVTNASTSCADLDFIFGFEYKTGCSMYSLRRCENSSNTSKFS